MIMNKALDFTKIIKKYKGKWIALTEDEKKAIIFSKFLSGNHHLHFCKLG